MGAFEERKTKTLKNKRFCKTLGLSLFAFFSALFVLLCIPTGQFLNFFLGTFGVSIYALCVVGMLIGLGLSAASKYQLQKRYFAYLIVNFVALTMLLHIAFSASLLKSGEWSSFGKYVVNCFEMKPRLTVGGLIFGALSFPFATLLGVVGACITLAIVLCLFVGLSVDFLISKRNFKSSLVRDGENRRLFARDKEMADSSSAFLSSDLSTSAAKIVPKKFEDEDEERYQKFRDHLTLKQDYFSNRLDEGDARKAVVSSVIRAEEIEGSIERPIPRIVLPDIEDSVKPVENEKMFDKMSARKILFGSNQKSEPESEQSILPSPKPVEKTVDDEIYPSKYDPEKFKSKKEYILTPILPDFLNHKNVAKKRLTEQEKNQNVLDSKIRLFDKPKDENPVSSSRIGGQSAREILFEKKPEFDFKGRTMPSVFVPQTEVAPDLISKNEQFVNESLKDQNLSNDRLSQVFETKREISKSVAENKIENLTPENKLLSDLFNPNKNRLSEPTKLAERIVPDRLANAFGKTEKNLSDLVENINESKNFESNQTPFQRPIRNVEPVSFVPIENKSVQQSFIPQTRPVFEKANVDVRYVAPDTKLLKLYREDTSRLSDDVKEKSRVLEETLKSFRIDAKVTNVVRGPSVTRYEISIPPGIPVRKVATYESDIAMALMSKTGIRMEVPIPGKNAVGVEIANEFPSTVGLRELLESREFVGAGGSLPVAIGKNISGEVVVKSLSKLVHTLVAGSTGSGKSVFLHNIIMSLMFKSSPEQLRFILIDPKCVEFSVYNNMPHLMLPNVITETDKAINALNWAVKEMERRYRLLQENLCQNIESFLSCPAVKNGIEKKIPNIVIVIDELAELMMVGKKEVEEKIRRLSQKGRASGIYLVVATQRPSVDVVTGTIKTNLPTRVALALSSFIDSRTVLDEGGAEKLLGKGDMLFSPQGSNAMRLQGAFVSIEEEVMPVIDFIKKNNTATYDETVEKLIVEGDEPVKSETDLADSGDDNGTDEFFFPALRLFVETGTASTSMLQRRFGLGFPRASRLIDQMEVKGYISPQNGSKKRNVYVTMDQYRALSGDEE